MFSCVFRRSIALLIPLALCGSCIDAHGQAVLDAAPPRAGTLRQQAWLAASINERVEIAEQIGEEGARAFAESKGWTALFDGFDKGVPQGPDQVYMAADGTVHVLEAKGGGGQLGHAYGHQQGSSEWAVEAARNLTRRGAATEPQKAAARQVLCAAAEGRLEVHVVRTAHTLGEPAPAVLEQTVVCSDAAKRLAASEIDDLAAVGKMAAAVATPSVKPAASAVVAKTSAAARVAPARAVPATNPGLSSVADDLAAPVLGTVAKAAGPLAIGIDAAVRIGDIGEAERLHSEGRISGTERDRVVARNAVGFVGSTAGAAGGAYGGAAIGTMICPGLGTAVGAFIGSVFGSVSGGAAGEAIGEVMAE